MTSDLQEKLLREMVQAVTNEVAGIVKAELGELVEKEVARALSRAVSEGDFLRTMNQDMRQGLSDIYREISQARQGQEKLAEGAGDEQELLNQATGELDSVIQATEEASLKIMDIVEKQMEAASRLEKMLADGPEGARELASGMNEQLMEIMTALSFQDLTGQRIRHAIETLKRVEGLVTDLYVSTGLMLEEHERDPEKAPEAVKRESRAKLVDGQEGCDDLLSQFGLG
ncbi:protein phosphatase CheZ [Desulfohalovibrio reitneri]|uniref:protein phosphatase CheZ n=1 Tax=Desulfohalovibrio reitneri TaxID=1307759 RepID=UPI0004A75942|nr:protein phosphatase CheZ [Desulfohalovibrio reitneri]